MPTCATCHATWGGVTPCHCAGCHRTFSGVHLFDRHRHHRGEHGGCLDPATLTGCEHRDGLWRAPEMSDAEKARVKGNR